MSTSTINGEVTVGQADETSFFDELEGLLAGDGDELSNVRSLDAEDAVVAGPGDDKIEEIETVPTVVAVDEPVKEALPTPSAERTKATMEKLAAEAAPVSVAVIPMPSRRSGEAKVGKAADALIAAVSISPAAAAAASKTVVSALLTVTMQMDSMELEELSTAYSGGDDLGAAAWVSQAAASYYAIARGLQTWRNKQTSGVAAKPPMDKINLEVAEQFSKDANRPVGKSTVYAHSRIWQTFFLGRKYVDPTTETEEGYNPWQALHVLVSRAYFEYALLAPENLQIPLLGIMMEKKLANTKYSVKDAYDDAQKVRAGISIDAVAAGEGEVAKATRTVREFDMPAATIAGQVGADATDYLVAIYAAAKNMGKLAPPAAGKFRAVYIWRSPDGRYAAHDEDMDAAEAARVAGGQGRAKPIYTIVAQDSNGTVTVINTESR